MTNKKRKIVVTDSSTIEKKATFMCRVVVFQHPGLKLYKVEELIDILVNNLKHLLCLVDIVLSMNEDMVVVVVVKPFLVILFDYNVSGCIQ
jgi:hypothetical protein